MLTCSNFVVTVTELPQNELEIQTMAPITFHDVRNSGARILLRKKHTVILYSD